MREKTARRRRRRDMTAETVVEEELACEREEGVRFGRRRGLTLQLQRDEE